MIEEITVQELAQRLSKDRDALTLLDVREQFERDLVHIGGHHIPLAQVPSAVESIPAGKELVVYCKGGSRSYDAAQYLLSTGLFTKVLNLKGGIKAWVEEIDASLPKYW